MASRIKTQQTTNTLYFDPEDLTPSVYDRKEFQEFVKVIENALTKKPQSIREILIRANTTNHYWFSLAIESLLSDGKAIKVYGYVTKFKRGAGAAEVVQQPSDRRHFNAGIFAQCPVCPVSKRKSLATLISQRARRPTLTFAQIVERLNFQVKNSII